MIRYRHSQGDMGTTPLEAKAEAVAKQRTVVVYVFRVLWIKAHKSKDFSVWEGKHVLHDDQLLGTSQIFSCVLLLCAGSLTWRQLSPAVARIDVVTIVAVALHDVATTMQVAWPRDVQTMLT